MPEERDRDRPEPRLEDFLGDHPTRDLERWAWLWEGDRPFPLSGRRGLLGRLLTAFKRLLRPLARLPVSDLWARQRIFNLILIEHLERLRHLESQVRHHDARFGPLESFQARGLNDAMRHNDALFARVDQKLDRYRREARDLYHGLSAALALIRPPAADTAAPAGVEPVAAAPALARFRDEQGYLELERRYRGTEEEIGERVARYLPYLEGAGEVLDLGCGRGEALKQLAGRGVPCRGVDSSAEMVARCRQQGLAAREGDLFGYLTAVEEGSLGGVVSFHVIEHLPADSLDRLVRLAWRALKPGGVLILETPNPLSLVVAARNFWLDPTHRRPVHPDSLELSFRLAGFDPVERLELNPFPPEQCLPEIDLAALPAEQHPLADRVNRLRDRLDDLLFGHQDYALIGTRS